MTGLDRHRLPEEPDPDEVAESFGVDAGKERAGPVEDDEPEDRPTGLPGDAEDGRGPDEGADTRPRA